ncbi:uncharacterized protein E0L32_001695 [Thyridium curvatum]|uniref:UBL3-like ubiquitin domain-containing protein n=1 Tax=Thyridium curvatum TaxID=1093900 RepID=A0A507AH57_9PEZI|nr:uncharacterized protein E0L32_001504 [Thyridium curvatum]XP_030990946.1 uncharacterized protein E0L32_001695 [Thyridium curvatum]TPX09044.1 hypothetical protein E0L32_001504 [Thyridium curvatum]TPX09235.1 hypothetical protein E0L32_001695 [Thyridium curvatum]
MAEPDKTASPAGAAAATAVPPVPSDAPEQKQPESSLQQPSDAVEMTTVEAGSAQNGDHHHHHHHNDAAAATGGADEPSSASVKGKEKETPAEEKTASGLEAETEPKRDSLSITRTDEHGGVSSPSDGPVCNITLLLPTGARHPYKIDERYLSKRSVDIPETNDEGRKDPFSISVYKLKELILREWRPEWEAKPASPSSIRLIHFGKLLDDKEQLKKYQFSAESPNVVHMSVRPAEMMEEDEAAKGKSSGREGRNRDGSSNCCIIL